MIIAPSLWTPDQPDLNNAGATEALNVIPAGTTYRPFKSLAPTGSAASSVRIQGAGSFRSSAGTIFNFCGDISKLYLLDGDDFTWADVSQSMVTYATPVEGMWRFYQFGDLVVAINGVDAPQSFNMSGGTAFEDLDGSPGAGAKFGAVVGGFGVHAAYTSNSQAVQWSALEDVEDWSASAITQSDAQTLPDGGQTMGIVGGEYGVVFQRRGIRKMSYIGAPLFFQFDKVTLEKGCMAEGSIAAFEGMVFFLSDDGLYRILGGQQVENIGSEKFNRWLIGRINQSYLYRITAAVDPVNTLYYLGFPNLDSADGTPNEILIYNYATGAASHAYVDHEFLYTAFSQSGYTADTIDKVIGNTDATDLSMDTTLFTGTGRQGLAAFDTDGKIAFFDGPALEATVTTLEAQLTEGRRTYVRGGRPLVQGSTTPQLALGYRNLQSEAVTYTSDVTMNGGGYCPFRNEAVYHRGRLKVSAGETWDHIIGMEPDAIPAGAPR